MTKKEIQEKLNNLPKPKYLYQRYNGNLYKYEVNDNILIDTKNANNIINIDEQLILGKVSEKIKDIIKERRLCKWRISKRKSIFDKYSRH